MGNVAAILSQPALDEDGTAVVLPPNILGKQDFCSMAVVHRYPQCSLDHLGLSCQVDALLASTIHLGQDLTWREMHPDTCISGRE